MQQQYSSSSQSTDINTDACLPRYQQAQALVQGIMSKRMVLNDGVFPHWIGSSACFWYQRETQAGKVFCLVNANTKGNKTAFNHQVLATALATASDNTVNPDDLPIKITELQLDETSSELSQVQFSAFDKHWAFNTQTQQCQINELPQKVQGILPSNSVSPDGTYSAYVKDHNLWLRTIDTDEERALTTDGIADNQYATAPASASVQILWSPDSKQILTHQLDMRNITARPMVEHVPQGGSIQTKLHKVKMAYPGDKTIEAYQLMVIDIERGEQQIINDNVRLWKFGSGYFTDEKLSFWNQNSQCLYYVNIARGSKTVRLHEFNTETKSSRVLIEDTADTFVKLAHNDAMPELTFLPDTNELIWFSERSGWAHLYLYNLTTGQLTNTITQGKWLVRHILHVDSDRRELILHTGGRNTGINPHYREVCCVNIDSSEITDIAVGNYEHSVFSTGYGRQVLTRGFHGIDTLGVEGISPDGQYIVTTRSRVDTAPESVLFNKSGEELLTLETADTHGLPENWVWPQPVKTLAADDQTDIHGVVYYPPGYDKNQRYPVLDFSNGQASFTMVPQGSFINGHCFDYPYYYAAAFAALGFIVVMLEGRGMPNRDKAFHDNSHGFMAGACNLEDRIAGIQQLAKLNPAMDLNRVGIVGGDGFSSPVYGLLEHPDFYKVGVAMAFEDSRLKSAVLSECFEGYSEQGKQIATTPHQFADQLAHKLEGKLLLIHGMVDMFAPQSGTLRLMNAFQQANKDVDTLLMPQVDHDIPPHSLRRTWDYLVTHLRDETPPKNFLLRMT
ncbi:S9 family peptidase [bacterium]|nr:S9 family peptidase [bacterium]